MRNLILFFVIMAMVAGCVSDPEPVAPQTVSKAEPSKKEAPKPAPVKQPEVKITGLAQLTSFFGKTHYDSVNKSLLISNTTQGIQKWNLGQYKIVHIYNAQSGKKGQPKLKIDITHHSGKKETIVAVYLVSEQSYHIIRSQ